MVGGFLPVAPVVLVGLLMAKPAPSYPQAAASVFIQCPVEGGPLAKDPRGLTEDDRNHLHRLGFVGSLGVVAIVTPWSANRPPHGPRTVVVMPQLPEGPAAVLGRPARRESSRLTPPLSALYVGRGVFRGGDSASGAAPGDPGGMPTRYPRRRTSGAPAYGDAPRARGYHLWRW